MKKLIGLLVLFGWAGAASAATYTYTGNNYDTLSSQYGLDIYDTSMNITISFTTEEILGAHIANPESLITSYVMSDGFNTITDADIPNGGFSLEFDSAGNISQWHIVLLAFPPGSLAGDAYSYEMRTKNDGTVASYDKGYSTICLAEPCKTGSRSAEYGHTAANPGTWTVSPSAVPVPTAAWLFGSALLGLGVVRRRKAQ